MLLCDFLEDPSLVVYLVLRLVDVIVQFLEPSFLEEGTSGPGLSDSAGTSDQLEHFVHVQVLDEVVPEDDVGDGEIGTIAEGFISDDVG